MRKEATDVRKSAELGVLRLYYRVNNTLTIVHLGQSLRRSKFQASRMTYKRRLCILLTAGRQRIAVRVILEHRQHSL